MPAPPRSEAMLAALRLVAPGTPLREGLDRILQAHMGALIVVGDGPDVLSVCSGGFLLDAEFTPQRLSELAKMDGAIILAVRRIADRPGQRAPRARPQHPHARRPAPGTAPPSGSPARSTCRSSRSPRTCRVVAIHRARREAHARADPARARPRRPGAPDPRALQVRLDCGERLAVGARGRGSRDRARRRHRAAARRDGAAHRRGDRGLRHRARRRRPAGAAPARGAHGRRRGRPPPRRQGLLPAAGRLRARAT